MHFLLLHCVLQGIQKYEFDMYLDLHKLQQGKTAEIQNKFVKRWHSFQALSNYADRTDDVALINKIKVYHSVIYILLHASVVSCFLLFFVHVLVHVKLSLSCCSLCADL